MTYPSNDGVDGGHLKAFIERIEKLEDEKSEVAETIRDVYSEAKGTGFCPKIIRKIVSARKKAEQARREEAELLRVYASAIGQLDLF
jgi:uncharacterized protein (UPF0335 family)